MLHKKQGKSDKWVIIPLRKEALEIIKTNADKGFPILTNAEFNRHIKNLGKMAGVSDQISCSHKKGTKDIVEVKPKYEWITSHTCRRSFCTNEFLAGTPPELIMKISGHKSIKDFYKYIRVSPEEAALKIKELWEKRGQMEVLEKKLVLKTE
jgi:integrase